MVARWRQDGGKMAARWRQDGGKMAARWRQDGGKMEARWRQDGGKMETRWWQDGGNMVARWRQDGGKMVARRRQDRGKTEARWRQDGGKMEARWQQDGGKMVARWRQDGGQMEARWQQDGGKTEARRQQDGGKMEARWWQDGGKMEARWRQDGGKMEARWWQDGGKMAARWWQDGGKMEARWRQDGGKTSSSPASGRVAFPQWITSRSQRIPADSSASPRLDRADDGLERRSAGHQTRFLPQEQKRSGFSAPWGSGPRFAAMAMSRKLLMMVVLLEFTNGVGTPPAPGSVCMDSVNMRHVLRWTQPTASCNSTVLYSVQYQGEFELLIKNGSWINAPECQRIPLTSCDLTSDLGSDSDYSLRVRAQCGSKMSAWTRFLFNRNNITPPVPELRVTAAGDVLLVSVRKFPLTAVTMVTMWRKDKEQQTQTYSMPADQEVLQVAALQEGTVYCVKAKVVLNLDVQSGFTDSHCVSITGPGAPAWKQPTAVTMTVVVTLGLLIGLFWSLVHCRPDSCQKYFQKEPLPPSLNGNFAVRIAIPQQREELCEETPHLLRGGAT
ncbi:uncharacterized protein LOC116720946 [Xiphophorus hellerii]|uniref:uncharacterized protein LOC116720946 n=1 Tax=Xiphophorus hellerii TaxID=8084 RepID=UPI0013B39525|nr:uncharacterized protein LOC116720946 [Xiphophorus hellerii]